MQHAVILYYVLIIHALRRNETINTETETKICFCVHHLNLKRKRNAIPKRLVHVQESFISPDKTKCNRSLG